MTVKKANATEVVETTEISTQSNTPITQPTAPVVTQDEISNNIMTDNDLGSFYSIVPTNRAEAMTLYNAINSPDKRVGDFINMAIDIKDVLIEIVELVQEATGEYVKCPRIILIDVNGVSYQCVSIGIMSGLKRMFKLFGPPTWTDPVRVVVKQITKGEKKMLSLSVVA